MAIRQRGLLLFVALLCAYAGGVLAQFHDPLDVAAIASDKAVASMLTGVTQTPGGRWVAVGRRGHVLYSDDGVAWQQAEVPVSVDLVAVHFPTTDDGWAVGHGGVILHSADGGKTWSRQLDGRQLADLLIEYWQPLAAQATEDEPSATFALQDAERFKEEGPGRPFLDVHFLDARTGYAVGAYDLLLETRDGGASWQLLSERADNPGALHFNAIALADDGRLYLAGEQGLLLRGDPQGGRFQAVATPYQGTWFGLLERNDLLLLFGLRGNAYVSHDQGASWSRVATGSDGTLTAGTLLADGRVALVSLKGEVLLSDDARGEHFTPLTIDRPTPLYGVAPAGEAALIAVGAAGVTRIDLESRQPSQ
ncbi:WD40/YVTN/BNR-like repeat-containing protein [Pseudomonas sp. B392_1p]|uniref:WD40/YVTN/BNR-like repeat-containing protein n=1 Tax=Pseudomonas sp. B392_1p TaxID=3457507 RepID=UPI003FD4659D